ncbi:CBS domain-containing protein [Vagococcus coleopterorum]|uniref:CBS domain-containing protein n=1 Tax=Vagococcus coleopterorum TaxID=2714946 RepID=A0A6G8ANT4_9ENTE|nr:cyclic-di-AMP-binding protein CbpB [Vagococcus coleopterorum]QIL46738.1 CBS domain-containing protein [Vagococcus coleopterorum]
MISEAVENILLKNADCFLVSDEKVAHVMDENPLTHALLMLTQVKYTRIPVLNREGHIVGLIGLSNIVNQMFDLAEIDPSNLEGLLVKDVMETEVPIITDPFDVEDILHKLVDHPFLAVVDEYNCFTGIVTRREILKSVNHLVHEIDLENH